MSVASLQQENQLLKEEIALLKQQIEWFKRHVFGAGKSEKLDKRQLPLGLEETAVAEPPGQTEKIAYERTKPTIHAPKLYRIEYIKRKYRLKADKEQAPVSAPSPKRPVQGIASISLLVHVILSKYADHLPLYRQEKMFKRYGAQIRSQNMVNWVALVAQWLKPIYNYMCEELISGNYLQTDETPIKVLDPDSSQKKIRQGWLWPISRPGADVVFSWSLTRGRTPGRVAVRLPWLPAVRRLLGLRQLRARA